MGCPTEHVGNPDPAGHEHAHWETVVRGQGLAVQSVDEQHVIESLFYGYGAAYVAARAHFRVEAFGLHVDSAAFEAGESQHVGKARAGPASDADGAQPPLRTGCRSSLLAREKTPRVARALDELRRADGRKREQLLVAEAERTSN